MGSTLTYVRVSDSPGSHSIFANNYVSSRRSCGMALHEGVTAASYKRSTIQSRNRRRNIPADEEVRESCFYFIKSASVMLCYI